MINTTRNRQQDREHPHQQRSDRRLSNLRNEVAPELDKKQETSKPQRFYGSVAVKVKVYLVLTVGSPAEKHKHIKIHIRDPVQSTSTRGTLRFIVIVREMRFLRCKNEKQETLKEILILSEKTKKHTKT